MVQKYIENPLLIQNRKVTNFIKFDIRQWVLVSSWNPLVIWFYDKAYLRFSGQDYEISDINNKYVHLNKIRAFDE